MKKLLLTATSGIISLATITFMTGSALAWTYGLTGSGQCQSDGSFDITWTLDNSVESEPLTITSSSNPAVVPVNTTVAAKSTENFTQDAPGTQAASFTLTLEGNFPSDKTMRSRTATVSLSTACTQPVTIPPTTTPPATTTTTTTTPTPASTPQTPAPAGSVNAGTGDPMAVDYAAIAGVGASVGLVIYGTKRFALSRSK